MAHDIFISYNSNDKATADAACAIIESEGLRCWIAPRNILPGTEWGANIIDGINGARALVLIFSQRANDSAQVRREVDRAVHVGIPVLPFRIERVRPTRTMEHLLSTVHWMDALTPPLEAHLRTLARNLKTLLQTVAAEKDISAPTAPATFSNDKIPSPKNGSRLATVLAVCLAFAVSGAWIVSRIINRGPGLTMPSRMTDTAPDSRTMNSVDPAHAPPLPATVPVQQIADPAPQQPTNPTNPQVTSPANAVTADPAHPDTPTPAKSETGAGRIQISSPITAYRQAFASDPRTIPGQSKGTIEGHEGKFTIVRFDGMAYNMYIDKELLDSDISH